MKRSEKIGLAIIKFILGAFAFSIIGGVHILIILIFIIPAGVCFYIKWWGTGLFLSLFVIYSVYDSVLNIFKDNDESKPNDVYSARLFFEILLLLPCALYITWTSYLPGNPLFVIDIVALVAMIVSLIVFQYARLKSHFQLIIFSRIVFVISHFILNVFCLLSLLVIWSISVDKPILYLSLIIIPGNLYTLTTMLFIDRHVHFFKMNMSDSYVLYLRSFSDDYEPDDDQNKNPMFIFNRHLYEESIHEQIGYLGYDVYCIADPTHFIHSLRDFNCFYLPHTNWEKAVLEMSLNASMIVISVGLSDGVIWEVLQGYRLKEKTIFHASSYKRLCDFIDNIKNREDVPADFISSINKLKEKIGLYRTILFINKPKKTKPLDYLLGDSGFSGRDLYFKLIDNEVVFSNEISDVANNVCPYDDEIQGFLSKAQKMLHENDSLTAHEKESLRNFIEKYTCY